MRRHIYKSLLEWGKTPRRKPLLLRGARQIGKTFIVNEFGKNEFKTCITLNFERNPEYKDIFSSYNPIDIIEKITLYTSKGIEKGETLIFLDEIQECPEAIMSLRYFYEEIPELHIIGAGSLLEFTLQAENYRIPVGRIQYLYMYPLSFSEFLIAVGEKPLNNHIADYDNIPNISTPLHHKLIEYIRKYFIIGGMPAVVKEYVTTRDILKCQKIQHAIIETYKDDFSKYARKSQYKYIKKVFSTIPAVIGGKIIYSKIDSTVKSRDIKAAFELLETAGVIYKVKRASGAGLPFESSIKENHYKSIFLDIGLMHAVNGIYSQTIKEKDLTAIYRGAVAEQFVGQELLTSGNQYKKTSLYYWAREEKNSNAEIDYLIEKDEKVIPLEVKSGKKGTLRSLLLFLKAYKLKQGIKISQAPYNHEIDLLSIPFYALESFMRKNTDLS